MDKKEYQKSLPKKRVSSAGLIFNEDGEILILKTTYKDHWSMVGGTVDENESPKEACKREIQEEIGLDLDVGNLLMVSYEWPRDENIEVLMFYFDCGVVEQEMIKKISLQEEEIEKYQFLPVEQAKNLLSETTKRKLEKALEVLKEPATSVYLEY